VRHLIGAVSAILAVGTVTACEPPPPRPSFVVDTTASATDAAPGDGVCETATGNSVCSLRAAIVEGNAMGAADISLPPGDYRDFSSPYPITGDLRITGTGPGAVTVHHNIWVNPGGILRLSTLSLTIDARHIIVEGVLLGSRVHIDAPYGAVDLRSTGTAVFDQSIIVSNLNYTVQNAGVFHARHSLLQGLILPPEYGGGGPPALETVGAGQSHVASSILSSEAYYDCVGTPPVSGGYNNTSYPFHGQCQLDGPGDVAGAPLGITWLGAGSSTAWAYVIAPDSSLVDAIPIGTNGCGNDVTTDFFGNPRPVDGDGDGIAACDIGPIERPAA
jgi:hypothetical protein